MGLVIIYSLIGLIACPQNNVPGNTSLSLSLF
jgi:hypothetical protein